MSTTATDAPIKYDVGPKEYADWDGVHPVTARKMFAKWFENGEPYIRRRGVATIKYPKGRDLVMSRKHFNDLKGLK